MPKVPRGSAAKSRRRKKRMAARRDALGVRKAQNVTTSPADPIAEVAAALGVDRTPEVQVRTTAYVMRRPIESYDQALEEGEAWGDYYEHGGPKPVFADEAATTAVLPVAMRRRIARAALTASGAAPVQPLLTSYDTAMGPLDGRAFVEAALAAGFEEFAHDSWPTEATELLPAGAILYRDEDSLVLRLDDGSIASVSNAWGMLRVRVAGASQKALAEHCSAFRAAYPASYMVEAGDFRVPITFWTLGKFGPVPRLRKIESALWDDIDSNYTGPVRDELARLMAWTEPQVDGQLLLWQGEPGTGKTWALRALASAWAPWAEFHYITDPDSFFVTDPSYMVDVLLSDSYASIDPADGQVYDETDPGGKWRVLILEDTGELLGANAKEAYGQGLSRLLNVVDGMIGQGLRVLALVTTNDELGDLHPAVARPGRCASQIEFAALTREEAADWLGVKPDVLEDDALTLAELYEMSSDSDAAPAFAAEDEPEPEVSEERAALAEVTEALQQAAACECSHPGSAHLDGAGPCTYEDDRGTCSCSEFAEATTEAAAAEEPDELTAGVEIQLGETGVLVAFTPEQIDAAVAALTDGDEEVAQAVRMRLENFTVAFATEAPVVPAEGPLDAAPVMPAEQPTRSDRVLRWNADIAPEGKLTDDGRAFAPGSIKWRELPLSLMAQLETADGHDGAIVSGRIDQIWREGDVLKATGIFDSGEFGMEIARLVGDGVLRGVSVDLAIHDYEYGPRSQFFDQDGNWHPQEAAAETTEDSVLDQLLAPPAESEEPIVFVVTDAVIGAVTVCSFPAFADASISLLAALVAGAAPNIWTVQQQAAWQVVAQPGTDGGDGGEPALTAAAAGIAPLSPPSDWFEAPEFDGPTGLTVTDDGQVFGHAALWDTCHIGIPDVCTTAPHSLAAYTFFHLKEVELDDGRRIACGTITLDTGHADRRYGRVDASAHYDDTGCAVADVVVGEDEHGIWVAGALRPDVDAEKARELRGATLSGDWRSVNGNLELVALLAVNVPGFPVPRTPSGLVASGEDGMEPLSLVAAGIVRA